VYSSWKSDNTVQRVRDLAFRSKY